jgi:hypothetical protein
MFMQLYFSVKYNYLLSTFKNLEEEKGEAKVDVDGENFYCRYKLIQRKVKVFKFEFADVRNCMYLRFLNLCAVARACRL